MRKITLIVTLLAFGLTFSMCKKGDDALFLLPNAGESSSASPAGVPATDLAVVSTDSYEGTGTVNEVTGSSASTPSGSSGSSGDSSGDSSGSSGSSGSSAASNGSSNDSSASGNQDNKSKDNKSKDNKSKDNKSNDSKSKDHKSKDHKSKDHKSGDKGKTNVVQIGKDFCYADGKWYKDAEAIFTYGGHPAGFCFDNLASGKYEVRIMARMWVKHGKNGKLPGDFKEYKVMIAADGVAGEMGITASSTGQKSGNATLDLTGGKTKVLVAWTNITKDVNFSVHQVKLQRIGDSERSALAAYLSGFSTTNYLLMLVILAAAIIGIVGINRMKKAQSGA